MASREHLVSHCMVQIAGLDGSSLVRSSKAFLRFLYYKRFSSLCFEQKYAMEYWRDKGAPAEKLLMGFPTYGRSLRLHSSCSTDKCASISGAGPPGKYTEEAGYLAYFEV